MQEMGHDPGGGGPITPGLASFPAYLSAKGAAEGVGSKEKGVCGVAATRATKLLARPSQWAFGAHAPGEGGTFTVPLPFSVLVLSPGTEVGTGSRHIPWRPGWPGTRPGL